MAEDKKDSGMTQLLSDEDKRALVELGSKLEFKKKACLFQKGDKGTCLYIIRAGEVHICVSSESGHEIILSRLSAGDIFGEIAMLDQKERTADAYVAKGTKLVSIDREKFLDFLDKRPALYKKVIMLLCERLRWFSDCVEDFALSGSLDRLVTRLMHLAGRGGREKNAVIEISQDDLAKMLGISREMVNRNLQILQTKKLLTVERKKIIIPDIECLADSQKKDLDFV
ncbi:MAG: Crp/Fnr family transcriptional regulator [Pseudomonadota bacterium]